MTNDEDLIMTNLENLKQNIQNWTAEMMWAALNPKHCPEFSGMIGECKDECRDCWIEFWNSEVENNDS